jgi:hypothetical protein
MEPVEPIAPIIRLSTTPPKPNLDAKNNAQRRKKIRPLQTTEVPMWKVIGDTPRRTRHKRRKIPDHF